MHHNYMIKCGLQITQSVHVHGKFTYFYVHGSWSYHDYTWTVLTSCLYKVMYTLAYIQTHIGPWSCIDIHSHTMHIPWSCIDIHRNTMHILICAMQLHTWTMVIPGLYIVKFTRLCITLEDAYTEYAYT